MCVLFDYFISFTHIQSYVSFRGTLCLDIYQFVQFENICRFICISVAILSIVSVRNSRVSVRVRYRHFIIIE